MFNIQIGSKVIFDDKPTWWTDITLGREYVIEGIDSDLDPYFIDDVGEANYAASLFNQELFHVVQ